MGGKWGWERIEGKIGKWRERGREGKGREGKGREKFFDPFPAVHRV